MFGWLKGKKEEAPPPSGRQQPSLQPASTPSVGTSGPIPSQSSGAPQQSAPSAVGSSQAIAAAISRQASVRDAQPAASAATASSGAPAGPSRSLVPEQSASPSGKIPPAAPALSAASSPSSVTGPSISQLQTAVSPLPLPFAPVPASIASTAAVISAAASASLPVPISAPSAAAGAPAGGQPAPAAAGARKGFNFKKRPAGGAAAGAADGGVGSGSSAGAASGSTYRPSALSRQVGAARPGDDDRYSTAGSLATGVGGLQGAAGLSAGGQPKLRFRVVDLMLHSLDFSPEDIVLNPEHFPGWQVGDFVVIRPATDVGTGLAAGLAAAVAAKDSLSAVSSGTLVTAGSGAASPGGTATPTMNAAPSADDSNVSILRRHRGRCLLLRIRSLGAVKGSLQASLSSITAETVGLRAKQTVEIRRLRDADEAARIFGLDHVEVSFRDQYASRSGMWRFRKAITNQCLYLGQAVTAAGLRMTVKELGAGPIVSSASFAHSGAGGDGKPEAVLSGMVTPSTKLTYRSRSSHIVLLIQMSREMWQFDNDGEMHFEKLVNRFLSTLFARWAALGATHSISIVLFSRTYYDLSISNLLELAGLSMPALLPNASENDKRPGGADGKSGNGHHGGLQRTRSAFVSTSSSSSRLAAAQDAVNSLPALSEEHDNEDDEARLQREEFERRRKQRREALLLRRRQRLAASLKDRALCVDSEGRIYEDSYLTICEDLVVQSSLFAGSTSSSSGSTAAAAGGAAPASASLPPSSAASFAESSAAASSSSTSTSGGMADWHRVLRSLKRAFSHFPVIANWGLAPDSEKQRRKKKREKCEKQSILLRKKRQEERERRRRGKLPRSASSSSSSSASSSSGDLLRREPSVQSFATSSGLPSTARMSSDGEAEEEDEVGWQNEDGEENDGQEEDEDEGDDDDEGSDEEEEDEFDDDAAASSSASPGSSLVQGMPSLAAQGNFLEAVNLCLNTFERHHMDRDLHRMGQNIIVLTAGPGAFEVDHTLSQMTKQRMMDNGIGCDIVSMARPPLHLVPLFITKKRQFTASGDGAAMQGKVAKHLGALYRHHGAAGTTTTTESGGEGDATVLPLSSLLPAPPTLQQRVVISYNQPHWIHCSFFGHISHLYSALTAGPLGGGGATGGSAKGDDAPAAGSLVMYFGGGHTASSSSASVGGGDTDSISGSAANTSGSGGGMVLFSGNLVPLSLIQHRIPRSLLPYLPFSVPLANMSAALAVASGFASGLGPAGSSNALTIRHAQQQSTASQQPQYGLLAASDSGYGRGGAFGGSLSSGASSSGGGIGGSSGTGSAAAAIVTGVAAGSLPIAIAEANAMLTAWQQADEAARSSLLMKRLHHHFMLAAAGMLNSAVGQGSSLGWTGPQKTQPSSLSSLKRGSSSPLHQAHVSSKRTAPSDVMPFFPYPSSSLFSLYAPRLTPLGPTYPAALLEILRRSGRVGKAIRALSYQEQQQQQRQKELLMLQQQQLEEEEEQEEEQARTQASQPPSSSSEEQSRGASPGLARRRSSSSSSSEGGTTSASSSSSSETSEDENSSDNDGAAMEISRRISNKSGKSHRTASTTLTTSTASENGAGGAGAGTAASSSRSASPEQPTEGPAGRKEKRRDSRKSSGGDEQNKARLRRKSTKQPAAARERLNTKDLEGGEERDEFHGRELGMLVRAGDGTTVLEKRQRAATTVSVALPTSSASNTADSSSNGGNAALQAATSESVHQATQSQSAQAAAQAALAIGLPLPTTTNATTVGGNAKKEKRRSSTKKTEGGSERADGSKDKKKEKKREKADKTKKVEKEEVRVAVLRPRQSSIGVAEGERATSSSIAAGMTASPSTKRQLLPMQRGKSTPKLGGMPSARSLGSAAPPPPPLQMVNRQASFATTSSPLVRLDEDDDVALVDTTNGGASGTNASGSATTPLASAGHHHHHSHGGGGLEAGSHATIGRLTGRTIGANSQRALALAAAAQAVASGATVPLARAASVAGFLQHQNSQHSLQGTPRLSGMGMSGTGNNASRNTLTGAASTSGGAQGQTLSGSKAANSGFFNGSSRGASGLAIAAAGGSPPFRSSPFVGSTAFEPSASSSTSSPLVRGRAGSTGSMGSTSIGLPLTSTMTNASATASNTATVTAPTNSVTGTITAAGKGNDAWLERFRKPAGGSNAAATSVAGGRSVSINTAANTTIGRRGGLPVSALLTGPSVDTASVAAAQHGDNDTPLTAAGLALASCKSGGTPTAAAAAAAAAASSGSNNASPAVTIGRSTNLAAVFGGVSPGGGTGVAKSPSGGNLAAATTVGGSHHPHLPLAGGGLGIWDHNQGLAARLQAALGGVGAAGNSRTIGASSLRGLGLGGGAAVGTGGPGIMLSASNQRSVGRGAGAAGRGRRAMLPPSFLPGNSTTSDASTAPASTTTGGINAPLPPTYRHGYSASAPVAPPSAAGVPLPTPAPAPSVPSGARFPTMARSSSVPSFIERQQALHGQGSPSLKAQQQPPRKGSRDGDDTATAEASPCSLRTVASSSSSSSSSPSLQPSSPATGGRSVVDSLRAAQQQAVAAQAQAALTSALSAPPQAVGMSGHDDFGYVVVEAPLPGVAASLLRRTPGNSQLYPWNKLIQRLTRRVAALSESVSETAVALKYENALLAKAAEQQLQQVLQAAAAAAAATTTPAGDVANVQPATPDADAAPKATPQQADLALSLAAAASTFASLATAAGQRSGLTGALAPGSSAPKGSDYYRSLYQSYREHDEGVFKRRRPQTLISSPSLQKLAAALKNADEAEAEAAKSAANAAGMTSTGVGASASQPTISRGRSSHNQSFRAVGSATSIGGAGPQTPSLGGLSSGTGGGVGLSLSNTDLPQLASSSAAVPSIKAAAAPPHPIAAQAPPVPPVSKQPSAIGGPVLTIATPRNADLEQQQGAVPTGGAPHGAAGAAVGLGPVSHAIEAAAVGILSASNTPTAGPVSTSGSSGTHAAPAAATGPAVVSGVYARTHVQRFAPPVTHLIPAAGAGSSTGLNPSHSHEATSSAAAPSSNANAAGSSPIKTSKGPKASSSAAGNNGKNTNATSTTTKVGPQEIYKAAVNAAPAPLTPLQLLSVLSTSPLLRVDDLSCTLPNALTAALSLAAASPSSPIASLTTTDILSLAALSSFDSDALLEFLPKDYFQFLHRLSKKLLLPLHKKLVKATTTAEDEDEDGEFEEGEEEEEAKEDEQGRKVGAPGSSTAVAARTLSLRGGSGSSSLIAPATSTSTSTSSISQGVLGPLHILRSRQGSAASAAMLMDQQQASQQQQSQMHPSGSDQWYVGMSATSRTERELEEKTTPSPEVLQGQNLLASTLATMKKRGSRQSLHSLLGSVQQQLMTIPPGGVMATPAELGPGDFFAFAHGSRRNASFVGCASGRCGCNGCVCFVVSFHFLCGFLCRPRQSYSDGCSLGFGRH
jgi:Vacuolar membrane-associated protein Iml1